MNVLFVITEFFVTIVFGRLIFSIVLLRIRKRSRRICISPLGF